VGGPPPGSAATATRPKPLAYVQGMKDYRENGLSTLTSGGWYTLHGNISDLVTSSPVYNDLLPSGIVL